MMNFEKLGSHKALRIAIISVWICCGVYLIASRILDSFLPPLLRQYQATASESTTVFDLLLVVAAISILIAAIVSSVGLYRYRRWARTGYLAATVAGVIFLRLLGPNVEHGFNAALGEIATTLSGVVLGIAYFGGIWPTDGDAEKRPG